jgi:hypothetical protein
MMIIIVTDLVAVVLCFNVDLGTYSLKCLLSLVYDVGDEELLCLAAEVLLVLPALACSGDGSR